MKTKVAILGSGNIGTDLMIKVLRTSKTLDVGVLVGIDPDSDGLAQGRGMGVPTLTGGIDDLLRWPGVEEIRMVFDATSAKAHGRHSGIARTRGMQMVDLTPAAAGPYVVPVVNMGAHFDSPDISMVSCGGQATIPIVAAVSRVAPVHYAEIVSSIASRSAGPGTRANIDEFTQTTARAVEIVGGARRGKAIIVLNPAEPPINMRNTVFCLSDEADTAEIARSIERMVDEVRGYVGGYRLKQEVQFDRIGADNAMILHGAGVFTGIKTSVFLEVEGSAHYLPAYAGNLDIMTSAALTTGERLAEQKWN
ncbi:MAG TPA: acetaldehyde dehydrogenase (acetylating) [Candidatus Acidoferrales bacterium]|jgi:acetaldehyde dehydrogenase|nr:acetaldehyde dehydrogenase (acetylating) [Candidatus Acidoferrales bacterium]